MSRVKFKAKTRQRTVYQIITFPLVKIRQYLVSELRGTVNFFKIRQKHTGTEIDIWNVT